jgi:hypothetical protein
MEKLFTFRNLMDRLCDETTPPTADILFIQQELKIVWENNLFVSLVRYAHKLADSVAGKIDSVFSDVAKTVAQKATDGVSHLFDVIQHIPQVQDVQTALQKFHKLSTAFRDKAVGFYHTVTLHARRVCQLVADVAKLIDVKVKRCNAAIRQVQAECEAAGSGSATGLRISDASLDKIRQTVTEFCRELLHELKTRLLGTLDAASLELSARLVGSVGFARPGCAGGALVTPPWLDAQLQLEEFVKLDLSDDDLVVVQDLGKWEGKLVAATNIDEKLAATYDGVVAEARAQADRLSAAAKTDAQKLAQEGQKLEASVGRTVDTLSAAAKAESAKVVDASQSLETKTAARYDLTTPDRSAPAADSTPSTAQTKMAADDIIAVGTGGPAAGGTSGSCTGFSFTPFNFCDANEDLLVTIDGQARTVSFTTDIRDVSAAVAALNDPVAGLLTGAIASRASGGNLSIVSSTMGLGSSVTISPDSGLHALGLIGVSASSLFQTAFKELNSVIAPILGAAAEQLQGIANEVVSALSDTAEEVLGGEVLDQFKGITAELQPELNAAWGFVKDRMGANIWRIRYVAISGVLQVQTASNLPDEISACLKNCLLDRKSAETQPEIKALLEHPEHAVDILAAMKTQWSTRKEVVQASLDESFKIIDQIQLSLDNESLAPPERKELSKLCVEENERLALKLQNVGDIGSQMGIAISFLKTMSKTLNRMEGKIDAIRDQLNLMDAKLDVLVDKLIGLPIEEAIQLRMSQLTRRPLKTQEGVHVVIDGVAAGPSNDFVVSKKNPACDLVEGILCRQLMQGVGSAEPEGLDQAERALPLPSGSSVGLILVAGAAGSGKTTALLAVEHNLAGQFHRNNQDTGRGTKPLYVVISISLAEVNEPLTQMVEETLQRDFGANEHGIHELQQKAQAGAIRVVFLIDGYDELGFGAAKKNLFVSNNLEKWGPSRDAEVVDQAAMEWPRVVMFCRSGMLLGWQDYQHAFLPLETDNKWKDENEEAVAFFSEYHIAPFAPYRAKGSKVREYVEQHIALRTREVLCGKFHCLSLSRGDLSADKVEALNKIAIGLQEQRANEASRGAKQQTTKMREYSELIQLILATFLADDEDSVDTSSINERALQTFVKKELGELGPWSRNEYERDFGVMRELENLTQTAFTVSIIVNILPRLHRAATGQAAIKKELSQLLEDEQEADILMVLLRKVQVTDLKTFTAKMGRKQPEGTGVNRTENEGVFDEDRLKCVMERGALLWAVQLPGWKNSPKLNPHESDGGTTQTPQMINPKLVFEQAGDIMRGALQGGGDAPGGNNLSPLSVILDLPHFESYHLDCLRQALDQKEVQWQRSCEVEEELCVAEASRNQGEIDRVKEVAERKQRENGERADGEDNEWTWINFGEWTSRIETFQDRSNRRVNTAEKKAAIVLLSALSDRYLTAVKRAFKRKELLRYQIYNAYVNFYVTREAKRQQSLSSIVPVDELQCNALGLATALAVEMTRQGQWNVRYRENAAASVLPAIAQPSIWDSFFATDLSSAAGRILIATRNAAPIAVSGNRYSLVHKSVQEYLVANACVAEITACVNCAVESSGTTMALLLQLLKKLAAPEETIPINVWIEDLSSRFHKQPKTMADVFIDLCEHHDLTCVEDIVDLSGDELRELGLDNLKVRKATLTAARSKAEQDPTAAIKDFAGGVPLLTEKLALDSFVKRCKANGYNFVHEMTAVKITEGALEKFGLQSHRLRMEVLSDLDQKRKYYEGASHEQMLQHARMCLRRAGVSDAKDAEETAQRMCDAVQQFSADLVGTQTLNKLLLVSAGT